MQRGVPGTDTRLRHWQRRTGPQWAHASCEQRLAIGGMPLDRSFHPARCTDLTCLKLRILIHHTNMLVLGCSVHMRWGAYPVLPASTAHVPAAPHATT